MYALELLGRHRLNNGESKITLLDFLSTCDCFVKNKIVFIEKRKIAFICLFSILDQNFSRFVLPLYHLLEMSTYWKYYHK